MIPNNQGNMCVTGCMNESCGATNINRISLLGFDSGDLPIDGLLEFFGLFLSPNTYTVGLSHAVIVTNERDGLLGLGRFEARVQFEVL